MPIHDQSYRRYAGSRESVGTAWMVIARNGITTIVRKRLFIGLLLLAWIPFVVAAVIAYLNANFPQFTVLAMTAQRFRDFLSTQDFFVFVITVWVGAGLIANDKRANALQIYLSKPLTRTEYIAGKLVILSAFLLLVTWLPAILLLVLHMAFTGSLTFLRQNFYLFPAVTVFAFLQVLVSAFLDAGPLVDEQEQPLRGDSLRGACTSSAKPCIGVIYAVTGSSRLSWLSLPGNLNQVGDLVFRLQPRYSTAPWVSVLALLVLVGVSLWVLERRVRGVEVVS